MAKKLSPEQLADAARLKALFNERKRELGITQESLALEFGYGAQSVVSQYLNGVIPLNVDAAIQFAGRLGCAVGEFSISLQAKIDAVAAYRSGAPAVTRQPSGSEWPFTVPRNVYDALPSKEKKRLDMMVRSFIDSYGLEKKRAAAA